MSENTGETDYEAKWYVVHTYSGHENKVAQNLEKIVENRKLHDLICDIKVPTEKVTEIREGKNGKMEQHEVERKTFPGYVLVKMLMTDESWYVVRNTRGVTGFVGPSSKPVPLSETEVANLGVELSSVEVSFELGDSVRIVDGPFEDFVGSVVELDVTNNKVVVLLSMFGRETRAELTLSQVAGLSG